MMTQARILVVEDDEKIAALLDDYFTAAGYLCTQIGNGLEAVAHVRKQPVDLVMLDRMLPGLDGIGVCREGRTFSQVPIVMLTARVDEIDRLLGLDSGADDYVCKPFSPREVVARARVHLRRTAGAPLPAAQAAKPEPVLSVDRHGMRILHDGVAMALTPV